MKNDDMLTSNGARTGGEKPRIGDSADAVWKQLNAEHQQLFPARGPSLFWRRSRPKPSRHEIEAVLDAAPVLVFGQRPRELRTRMRRRSRDTIVEQGLLFVAR